MKLSFAMKQLEYEPPRVRVTLTTPDGGIYPVFLPADTVELSDSELEAMALDKIYEVNFPLKAEKEQYEKLENLYEVLKQQNIENKKTIEAAVAELTELVTTSMLQLLSPMTDALPSTEVGEE